MWYLIGLFICLAYVIVMPFIRYKEYWNTLIRTFGEKIEVWNTLFGHFSASIIPYNLDYNDYSRIVGDDYSNGNALFVLTVVLICVLGWFIVIPLTFLVIIFLIIKRVIENCIKDQATKPNSKKVL